MNQFTERNRSLVIVFLALNLNLSRSRLVISLLDCGNCSNRGSISFLFRSFLSLRDNRRLFSCLTELLFFRFSLLLLCFIRSLLRLEFFLALLEENELLRALFGDHLLCLLLIREEVGVASEEGVN